MTSIELTIRDDDGNIISSSHKRVYELNIGIGDSDSIEGAIEKFRHKALKDIHKDLLSNAQDESDSRIKKKGFACNGKTPVTIRSPHGKSVFGVCRFRGTENGKEIWPTRIGLTGQFPAGYVSNRLREFSAFHSNRMSYAGAEELLRRVCGTRVRAVRESVRLLLRKLSK